MKTLFLGLTVLLSMTGLAQADCPEQEQKVLVIDLKSGWWAGDGGTFGQKLKDSIEEQCPTIKFEYRHSTYSGYGSFGGGFGGGFGSFGNPTPGNFDQLNQMDPFASGENKFPKLPFSEYDQIFLLSGGEADSVDLRVESAEFQRYLKGMVGAKANLFVGAGFGNVYHANALSQGLGLGDFFKTDKIANIFPHWTEQAVKVDSKLEVESDHPVLKGVTQLANKMTVGGHTIEADIASEAESTPIIENENGTVISEAELENGRKVILDSGMQRLYTIFTPHDEGQSRRYLLNIITHLSK